MQFQLFGLIVIGLALAAFTAGPLTQIAADAGKTVGIAAGSSFPS